jgi:hypothetical protein
MRLPISVAVLAFAISGAAAAATTSGKFVGGSTTVAEVEQVFGAPMDTSMQPDGALTLVYPASRVSTAANPGAEGQTIYLHFGSDFVLRHVTRSASVSPQSSRGFASK